jgi:phage anti-repressor protein
MKELIAVHKNKLGTHSVDCISAYELYLGLGLNNSHWKRWAKTNIEKNEFFLVGKDWVQLASKASQSNNFSQDYLVTLEFGKHLSMMAKTTKAHDYRNYLLRCEKELTRIRERHLTVEWQEARANGKCVRNVLTDVVKAYERLADKQGGLKLDKPENRHYYSTITKMVYKELFGDGKLKNVRDKLDALKLQFLSICEESCAEELEKMIELELDYHDIYQECRKRVIVTVEGLSKSRLTGEDTVVKLAWDKTQVVKQV